jgi:hypothetical protein
MDSLELKATCRCGAAHLLFSVPWSSLPLRGEACYCTDCRTCTGVNPAIYVLTSGAPQPLENIEREMRSGSLRKYVSSSRYTRWFCGTCGAHIVSLLCSSYAYSHLDASGKAISNSDTPTHWSFAAGAIPTYVHAPSGERVRTSVLAQHAFVKPEDGVGVAHAIDDGAPRFVDDGDTPVPADLLTPTPAPNNGIPAPPSDPSALLPLRCHCGTFRAALRRPSMLQMPSDMLRDSWNDHWAWSLCACNDCRRSSGFPLSSFIFVSAAAVVSSDGEAADPFKLPGLVDHVSSPNTRRAFCGTCGASVFYQYSRAESASHPAEAADTLDVHFGVLDCPDGLGTAYREWLWHRAGAGSMRHMEDRELADALRRGLDRLQSANA